MKKTLCLLFLLGLMGGVLQAGQTFSVAATGNILLPGDSGYKEVYGNSQFFPELKVGLALTENLYLWAGYGYVYKKGQTPVLKLEAKSTQHFLSLGAGYQGMLTDQMGYEVKAGLFLVPLKEEAMSTSASGTALGFRADAGLSYAVAGPVFVVAEAGYLYSSATINGEKVKPGGFRAGLGLGAKF